MNRALYTLVVAVLVGGCGGDGPTVPKSTAPNQQAGITPAQPHGVEDQKKNKGSEVAIIPDGARYSIECARYAGPDRIQQSRLAKEQMISKTGRKDFYVTHHTDYSVLMLGYYKDINRNIDPAEAKRSADDLEWLEKFKSPMGGRMFSRALKVAITTADPDAPPEWDLARLNTGKSADDPGLKFWTVVVAAYTNDVKDEKGHPADRKKLAVDSVRAARQQNIEAYYYHGESMSQICIGAWPRNAIREQEMAAAGSQSEARANSGEVLVVSPAPLGDKFTDKLQKEHDVKVVQPKVDVMDPSMAKVLATYDTYAVNFAGQMVKMTDPNTRKTTVRPQPSFLSEIPRNMGMGRASGVEPEPTMVNPVGPGTGTTGGLRRQPR